MNSLQAPAGPDVICPSVSEKKYWLSKAFRPSMHLPIKARDTERRHWVPMRAWRRKPLDTNFELAAGAIRNLARFYGLGRAADSRICGLTVSLAFHH